ncbi:MAG: TIGR03620 family F420-dependent LLM class oxidoreductase [Propionibacteriales bacterium]|nr:TIGR03620 family F420-dependent LLM class oxidoreductase [Propionibacteriales bacterium]
MTSAVDMLGATGLWAGQLSLLPARTVRPLLTQLEGLGFDTLWINESLSKEAFAHAGFLLGETERVTVATGIANIWARDPIAMRNGGRTLTDAHPDRFVLGVGVSHGPLVGTRGHDYGSPLERMRTYLADMAAAPFRAPQPDSPEDLRPEGTTPIILAALGPRMLELAREAADGATPYVIDPNHTRRAREILGPDRVLAPAQAVCMERDAGRARTLARAWLALYLGLPNYANNLRRLGYTDEDLAHGGSDALVDGIVAWGGPGAAAERVAAHREAGADHVTVYVLGEGPDDLRMADVEAVAAALA